MLRTTRSPDDAGAPEVSVPPARWDALFAKNPDPWNLASNWYDQRKFGVTLATLPRQRYRRCFEPGCANGDLTLLLAERCEELVATDCAVQAVGQARARLSGHQHVTVETAVLPGDAPDGTFDLVVLSEVLYYMSADDRDATVRLALDRLEPDGDLVLVHWRSRRRLGYDGHNIQSAVRSQVGHDPIIRLDDQKFLLEIYRKPA